MNGVSLLRQARLLASRAPEGIGRWNVLPLVVCGAPAIVLAYLTISRILAETGGIPAAALDDSYIHFQFARSFASGSPFTYSPSDAPVPGATSVLWPLLLALPYALGANGHAIVWFAWFYGFVSLGLLAWEARRMAERLCSPLTAWGAALLVCAFGPNTWFAASGMEVVPLAWLLLRSARRAAEWWEEGDEGGRSSPGRRRELVALAFLSPLMRPEGMLGTLFVTAALLARPRGASRFRAALPALGLFAPAILNFVFTREFATTTAEAKWLPLRSYATAASLLESLYDYATLLLGTLLNGKVWSALFLPEGSAPIALLSLVAILVQGARRRLFARTAFLLVLALGILIPGTFDCPLCNRLRYLWPFFPAWLVGAAVLAELLGERFRSVGGAEVGPMICGIFAGWLGSLVHYSIDDVAESANAILNQQVSLGLWAREELPEATRIGVNDAGAIAYFSRHDTFDIVGLTTRGEARYWTAGAGSRFEHYERLGAARLPSHFIVYPEWFALDPLLGEELTARYVPGATILGGARMSAHVADYSSLGSGERPDQALTDGRKVLDRLDVADLESEASHEYELFDATQVGNVLISEPEDGELGRVRRLDGARTSRRRDRFRLAVEPGGALLLRVSADSPLTLEVSVGTRNFSLAVPASRWHEARLELPSDLPRGIARVSVSSPEGEFAALHYFSLSAASPAAR